MDWKPTYDPVVGFRHRKASWKLFKKVVSVDFHNFIHNYDLKAIYENEKFLVKDVGMNTIYVENLRELSDLCEIMDDPEGGPFLQLAKKVTQSMINIMYDEEKAAFLDVYGK
jgi:hypothetical protein